MARTGSSGAASSAECFSEDLKRYANGWFCDPEEAALVRISDSSETYQVDFDERSRQFQRDQIETAMAQVTPVIDVYRTTPRDLWRIASDQGAKGLRRGVGRNDGGSAPLDQGR